MGLIPEMDSNVDGAVADDEHSAGGASVSSVSLCFFLCQHLVAKESFFQNSQINTMYDVFLISIIGVLFD